MCDGIFKCLTIGITSENTVGKHKVIVINRLGSRERLRSLDAKLICDGIFKCLTIEITGDGTVNKH